MNIPNWKKIITSVAIITSIILPIRTLILLSKSIKVPTVKTNQTVYVQMQLSEDSQNKNPFKQSKRIEKTQVVTDVIVDTEQSLESVEVIEPNIIPQMTEKSSEVVEVVVAEIRKTPEQISESSKEDQTLDRTKPLYEVYKNGYTVKVSTELQWYIRDICENYSFYEKYVYGMILAESTFKPTVSNGDCIGLCQINSYWITNDIIPHFTDDYEKRDLRDPYDNLLTMCEMWCYAKNFYDLDLITDDGMVKVLYWHATGRNPLTISQYRYADICRSYGNELVPLQ